MLLQSRAFHHEMSLCVRKPTIWVPTRFDTNRAVQSQKMIKGWKFWIWKEEELHNPCSENKGADQLRSYCEADLRLCFRLSRLLVFPCSGSNNLFSDMYKPLHQKNSSLHNAKTKTQISSAVR